MADLTRAARFGAAYAILMPAHDLADHVVQTDHQAAHKAGPGRAGARAMAGHVGGYTALQLLGLLALRVLGVRPSPRRTAAAVALSAGTHAFIDRRWPVRWLLEHTRSKDFADLQTPICGMYVADQALHHLVLAVCAWILAGGRRA